MCIMLAIVVLYYSSDYKQSTWWPNNTGNATRNRSPTNSCNAPRTNYGKTSKKT